MTRPLNELLAAADALKVAPLYAAPMPHAITVKDIRHELAHRDMIASELADAVREMQKRLDVYRTSLEESESTEHKLRAKLRKALNDVAQKAMDYSRNTDFGGEDAERLAALDASKDAAERLFLSAPPAPIDEAAERKEMAKPFRDFFGAEFADPDWEMEHVFWYEAWLAAKRHVGAIRPDEKEPPR